ncbi:jg13768 [Pararge aegeria aegeria]|uniref:Jg13768 protein n=1 Tax=Pararge aegeria aegeria TaxID=348720 RepID=A0A8S4QRB3_9NEOP|nr:jg13768 [Pararge aegeria aegeria]
MSRAFARAATFPPRPNGGVQCDAAAGSRCVVGDMRTARSVTNLLLSVEGALFAWHGSHAARGSHRVTWKCIVVVFTSKYAFLTRWRRGITSLIFAKR